MKLDSTIIWDETKELSYQGNKEKEILNELVQNRIWDEFSRRGWTHPPKHKTWGELADKIESNPRLINDCELERSIMVRFLRKAQEFTKKLDQKWEEQWKEQKKVVGVQNQEIINDLGILG